MTLKEFQEKPEWNWFEFFSLSDEHKEKIYELARTKSSKWITCACGQLCKELKKDPDKAPDDEKLIILGVKFYNRIIGKEWFFAQKILYKIEKRSLYLLKNRK